MNRPDNDKRRFVFQGVGTRGDIAPLIALGGELVARGHESHLLANAAYREEAQGAGMKFFPITEQTEIFRGSERDNPENYLFTCLDAVGSYFRKHLDFAVPTLVVNADRCFASNLFCELHELPALRLYLTPAKIRSFAAPSWPLGARAAGYFGHTFRTYALPKIYQARDRDGRLLATINRRRSAVGLQPVEAAFYVEPYVRRHVALFPHWYAPPAQDWPHGIQCVGFPFRMSSSECMPAGLAEVIARGIKPIVFTPGTCAPHDSEALLHLATACCAELALPGVFLSRYLERNAPVAGGSLVGVDYVGLDILLQHAAVLVHHGGIGTTAQAIRAGVPQVILPQRFDQPDNGRRVAEFGIGIVLEPARVTAHALAAAARKLLGDPAYRARLVPLRDQVRATNAVARAADLLEKVTLGPAAGSPPPTEGEHLATPTRRTDLAPVAPSRFRRRVMFVVWPEPEEAVAPAALAHELMERGDRVLMASAGSFGAHVRSLGFEHVGLTGTSDWGRRWSVFEAMPSRAALREAVDRLVHAFNAAIERHRPDLVLFDSRYSALGILAEAAELRWATYEADLPRELDPVVPPPQTMIVPNGEPRSTELIRTAWLNQLRHALWVRERIRSADLPYDWSQRYFPGALIDELERRFGHRVTFDRFVAYAPVARVPRIVFCPRAFDFERSRTRERGVWVGGCIDAQQPEPDFPWNALRDDRPVAYVELGVESWRSPRAAALLQTVSRVFAERDDFFVVVASRDGLEHCSPALAGGQRRFTVERAPWTLLSRARLVVVDARFSRLKECAAAGVAIIALATGDDQLRNAALIEHLGLGVAVDARDELSAARLDTLVTQVSSSAEVRERCARMRRAFEEASGPARALAFIDGLLAGSRDGNAIERRHSGRSPSRGCLGGAA